MKSLKFLLLVLLVFCVGFWGGESVTKEWFKRWVSCTNDCVRKQDSQIHQCEVLANSIMRYPFRDCVGRAREGMLECRTNCVVEKK